MMQKNVETSSTLEEDIQSLISLQTSTAMGTLEGSQPNVARDAGFWDAEGHRGESMNKCGQLQQSRVLRTMSLVQVPSMAHRELSIQGFGLIEP
jgi:hypothetical protein